MIFIKTSTLHLFKILFYLGHKDEDTYKITDNAVTNVLRYSSLGLTSMS